MSLIHDKKEQDLLRHSGRILGSCLIHLGNMIKPGISAGDLNRFAIKFIESHKAKAPFLGYMGFPHALCTSFNEEVVHGLSLESKIIKEGDIVSLDLGVDYNGFITDAARSYVVTAQGVASTEEIYQIYSKPVASKQFFKANSSTATLEDKIKLIVRTEESLQKSINIIKAGSRIGDIGAAIDNYVSIFGYGNVLALGGHGVGRAVHEGPYIANKGKRGQGGLLVENLVIAIEPMLTMGGGDVKFRKDPKYRWEEVVTSDFSLSAHFEDTVIITKKGCEVVTRVNRDQLLF